MKSRDLLVKIELILLNEEIKSYRYLWLNLKNVFKLTVGSYPVKTDRGIVDTFILLD
jgi:hypothetical protein